MDTVERLKAYLDAKGISVASAETTCGVANSTFRKAFTNGGSIKSDNLEKILNAYPDISAEWLMRGTGSMCKGEEMDHEQMFKAMNMPSNSDKIIELWMRFMECTKSMQEMYMKTSQK